MPHGNAQDVLLRVSAVVLFEDYYVLWSGNCRTNVGESWCKVQDKLINKHILPILQRKHMSEITPTDISEVLQKAKLNELSAKTRLHLYTIMYSMFHAANEFFEMGIKSPVKPKFHKPKVPKKKALFMSPMQTYMLLEYVMNTRYGPAVWLMALAGLRISEVLPRKWGGCGF